MKIAIEYCGVWNYRPTAARLAAAIEGGTSLAVELIEGSGGVFTISVAGKVVYSKQKTGRFPSEKEVADIIRDLAGGRNPAQLAPPSDPVPGR